MPVTKCEQGFAYVMLLVAIVVMGVLAERAVLMISTAVQRDREAELLFRGQAYRNAIRSYVETGADHRYPRRLEDLLSDPRSIHKRHLRQLYPDPMTADGRWQLLRAADGGIVGVGSSSESTPIKQSGFPQGLEAFEGAARYQDWVFSAVSTAGF